MSFTEKLLAYTTRIEKQLVELGGSGKGMLEKARSVPLRSTSLMRDLRRVASVRNQLVHDHDYRFAGDEERFFGMCEQLVLRLSQIRPANVPRQAHTTGEGRATSDTSKAFPGRPQYPPPNSREPVSSRPPSVEKQFRREVTGTVPTPKHSSTSTDAGSGKASTSNEPHRQSSSDSGQPSSGSGESSGSSGTSSPTFLHLRRLWIVPGVVAVATAVLCLRILPSVCSRTVESGFWPFRSTHSEPVWWLVWLLTAIASGGGFALTRRRMTTGR